jgi:Lysozyme like domain
MKALYVLILMFPLLFLRSPLQYYERVKTVNPCDENLEVKVNVENCIRYVWRANPDQIEVAVAIAKAESRLEHDAVNENKKGHKVISRDYSIFQLNDYYNEGVETLSARENIEKAHEIFEKHGWKRWCTFSSGRYKSFLNS